MKLMKDNSSWEIVQCEKNERSWKKEVPPHESRNSKENNKTNSNLQM